MPKINEDIRKKNRDGIIEHAERLFFEQGYSRTSVNDIIKTAGISKGKFYTYFESKEDLFFDIIYRVDDDIRKTKKEFTILDDYIAYRLKRILKANNRVRAKFLMEFWSSTELNEHQKQLFQKRYDGFKKDLHHIVIEGQKRGLYSKDLEMDTYLHVLMSSLDGVMIMDAVLNQPITDEIIQMTIKVLTRYLKGGEL